MTFLGQMGALGPGLVTVTRDPSLVGLDTGAMQAAAAAYASAAQKLAGVSGQIGSATSSVVGTPAWIGVGGIGFSMSADQASGAATAAAGALGPVSTALKLLANELDVAVAQAAQAEALAAQVNTATAQLNSSYDQRVGQLLATQPGGPILGTLGIGGGTGPDPAEAAAAAQLNDQAGQAQRMMDRANLQARTAWQAAAGAFDAATSQAPSVRAAVGKAQAAAAAKYKSDHQGNLLMGGLAALGMVAIPVGSGLADFFSGGAAAVGTPEEIAAEGALGTEVAASFGSVDAAALTSAEETAATATTVDGTALDGQVVNDATKAGSIQDVNPLGGTLNCVNCVVAGDATLSGSAATALDSDGAQALSILEKTYGGSFEPVGGQSAIEQQLLDAGPGARGIVYGSRVTPDGAPDIGHVFNAVNEDGTVRFIDFQSGRPASFTDGYDGFEFLRTNP